MEEFHLSYTRRGGDFFEKKGSESRHRKNDRSRPQKRKGRERGNQPNESQRKVLLAV